MLGQGGEAEARDQRRPAASGNCECARRACEALAAARARLARSALCVQWEADTVGMVQGAMQGAVQDSSASQSQDTHLGKNKNKQLKGGKVREKKSAGSEYEEGFRAGDALCPHQGFCFLCRDGLRSAGGVPSNDQCCGRSFGRLSKYLKL